MKPPCLFLLCLIFGAFVGSHCLAQTAKDASADQTVATMVEPFSGKILFHQESTGVFYEVNIAKGIVTGGLQHMRDSDTPIAQIVGGWYDHNAGRLVLLIQLTSGDLGSRWLSQCQQFYVDLANKQVTLDHMLHGYGLTAENSGRRHGARSRLHGRVGALGRTQVSRRRPGGNFSALPFAGFLSMLGRTCSAKFFPPPLSAWTPAR